MYNLIKMNFQVKDINLATKKTLKKWVIPNVNMDVISDLEYAYVRNIINKNKISSSPIALAIAETNS